MAEELTGRERYFQRIQSLALSALPVTELSMTSAAPQHHDGVMVALVPDNPEDLAVEDESALPADDLHITFCYFGKIQDLSTFDQTRILNKTRSVVNSVGEQFEAAPDGVVVMGQNEDGVPATAMLIQSDEIVALYDALSEALDYKSKFPSYIPHMTMGYGTPVEAAQENVGKTVPFSKVIVKFGDVVHDVPLPSAMVAAPQANTIDRVIDSLGRLWDEALHPRDREGKFIKKNGAISGQLTVPRPNGKGHTTLSANRASVIGFKAVGDDVWVLAEVTNPDGTKFQGVAKATDVRASAPVKARLDALYPISEGDDFVDSSLERKRQVDLILAHINKEYGPSNDTQGARDFLDGLGLWTQDENYINDGGDPEYLGGIRRVDHDLDADELDEQQDIIEDARQVKAMRDRVHELGSDEDVHVPPEQRLRVGTGPDQEVVDALDAGSDPFELETDNLLAAMDASGRFERRDPTAKTGVSKIWWYVDDSDQTSNEVGLAGTKSSTTGRAYFVKESTIGADLGNTDVVREVLASTLYEQVAFGDDRVLPVVKSVFGDNPSWDGQRVDSLPDDDKTHQPAHVISQHAGDFISPDWITTDAATEEALMLNDVRETDMNVRADMLAAFREDMGDLYGLETAKLILWDFLTLNGDRNPGNALLAHSPDGSESRIVPVDHGYAFDEGPDIDDSYAEGIEGQFEWFMNYPFTKGWMDYVLGGLAVDGPVSEGTLRRIAQDFTDVYSNLDAADIMSAMQSIPGITDEQIERADVWVAGVLDRIAWMRDNMETVLQGLLGKKIRPKKPVSDQGLM